MKDAEPIIGIDLGTTNSLVAYADAAGPRLIHGPLGDDDVILPSVVAFDENGDKMTIGREARAHAVERPLTTIHSIKRLMGRGVADMADELSHLPYRVESLHDDDENRDIASVVIGNNRLSPPEISALYLRTLAQWAERHFGKPVTRAVITVPAHFDDAQRQATRDAGSIAGLTVERIVNEPTAAALAYGLDRMNEGTIAVYDLGGGTFDISLLTIEDGIFEVLSTDGDTHLGGDDFDRKLIAMFTTEIHEQFGVDINTPTIKQQLRTLAENIKIRLSEEETAPIEIAINEGRVYQRIVTRDEFEGMIAPFVDRTIEACNRAMKAAGKRADDIDKVVMVGGSTRVPFVRRRVGEVFDTTPYTALNPDQVVALGAAVQGSILAGTQRDMLLLDVTPLSLGIETLGGAMGKLLAANVRIPCQASETFTTFQDGQTAVKINVLQGERELAKDCRSLGVFELRDIPPMPSGIPKIEVTFLIDQNGILNVFAKEQRSGRAASVQIIPSHGLTREEVKQRETEALEHAREDMAAHHLIDVRTTLEFDLNKAEHMIERFGHLVSVEERTKLAHGIAEIRAFAETSNDPVAINEKREAFNRMTIPLAEVGMTASLQEQDTSTGEVSGPEKASRSG